MLQVTLILFGSLSVTFADRIRLTSVSESIFNQYLYRRLKNENPPSTSDPALVDARVRKELCDDIAGSGLFASFYHMNPVDEKKLYAELKDPRHAHIFRQIYCPGRNLMNRLLSLRPKYTNEFVQETFTVNNSFAVDDPFNANEYVFVCILKEFYFNYIQVLYISKEYNLNDPNSGQPFKPGRFVFEKRQAVHRMHVRLAEETAQDYATARESFNIEMYYLEIRSRRLPVLDPDQDPICVLASVQREDNQLSRLCTAVLTSEFFRNRFKYPMQLSIPGCEKKRVSFLTEDGVRKSALKKFYEYVVPCKALGINYGNIKTYYISRAYTNNHVFVYESDFIDNKIYLRNLSTNLSFVREPAVFNFDDVE